MRPIVFVPNMEDYYHDGRGIRRRGKVNLKKKTRRKLRSLDRRIKAIQEQGG